MFMSCDSRLTVKMYTLHSLFITEYRAIVSHRNLVCNLLITQICNKIYNNINILYVPNTYTIKKIPKFNSIGTMFIIVFWNVY